MEVLESFLTDKLDWRPEVNSKVALVNSQKDLMRWLAGRMASTESDVELERGLYVCALVGTNNKEFARVFVDVVTIERLVALVKKFQNNANVQKKLLYLLNVLGVDENIRAELCEGGVAEAVIAVMNAHSRSDVVQERASMALSRLTASELKYQLRIAVTGGMRALAEMLDRHGANASIALTGAVAVRNLTKNCPENVLLAKQLSIPKLLLMTAQNCGNQKQAQTQLLFTLVSLAQADEDLQKTYGNDEHFVMPIAAFVKSAGDSKQFADLSMELLSLSVSTRNEEILNRLGELGYIPVLIKLVDAYDQDVTLSLHACNIFRGLAVTKKNRDLLREEEGILKTIKLLKVHAHDAGVVEQCLSVLSNACFNSVENQEYIGKSGGIEETIKGMEIHREKESIQDRGCRALRNYASNCEYNIRLEGDRDAIQCLILAMMSFPESQSVHDQAVAGLLNLARFEQNILRMIEKDVPDVVQKSLQNFDSDELTQRSSRLINILEQPFTSNVESSMTRSLTRGLTRSLSRGSSVSLQRAKTEQQRERGMTTRISRMHSAHAQRNKKEEAERATDNTMKQALKGLKRAVSTKR